MKTLALLCATALAAALAKPTPPKHNVGKPSLAAPQEATEQVNFEYEARVFGICVRGTECKSGELWLENATATEARWVLPPTFSFDQLEKHYRALLAKGGYVVIGSRVDDFKHERHLAARKDAGGGKVRGLELLLRATRASAAVQPLHVVEYWEGVGRVLGAR